MQRYVVLCKRTLPDGQIRELSEWHELFCHAVEGLKDHQRLPWEQVTFQACDVIAGPPGTKRALALGRWYQARLTEQGHG